MVRILGNHARGLLLAAALLPAVSAAQDETAPSEKPSAPAVAVAVEVPVAAAWTPPTLAAVVEHLSIPNRKKFADLLAADWKKRPDWADMLLVLLKGEEMGPGAGWFKPSEKKYDWNWLADHFDANSDRTISPAELGVKDSESERFFSRLDRDNDGVLREADFDFFSRQPGTPALVMSSFLSGLFDTDSNGRISPEELTAFLKRADADKTGFITAEDMYLEFTRAFADRENGVSDMPRPNRLLPMFFQGELGMFEAGPALGEAAPDFTLPTSDGSDTVTLSRSQGKPVILIFGSFT